MVTGSGGMFHIPRLEARVNAPFQLFDDVRRGVNVNAGCCGRCHGLVPLALEMDLFVSQAAHAFGERNNEPKAGGRAVKDDRRGGHPSAQASFERGR